jgi:small subunit ribosomal protein S6
MRKYEIIFVVKPDVTEEDIGKIITQMEGVVTGSGGTIDKVEKMGRRRLAYRVARQREGFYILFLASGSGDMVKEFERRLKVADAVIKYMTVRVDEDLERVAKYKELRAKQESRRPRNRPSAAPAQTPAPAAAPAPAPASAEPAV